MQTGIVYLAPPRVSPDDEGYWAFHGTRDLLGQYGTPDAAERDLARLVEAGEFPAGYWPEEARRLRLTLSGVAVFPEGRPSPNGRAVQVSAMFVDRAALLQRSSGRHRSRLLKPTRIDAFWFRFDPTRDVTKKRLERLELGRRTG